MNRIFLLLFGAMTFVAQAHAQVPDYVPTEGLVGWYPFNGNANDESGNGNDGEVIGATAHEDRFGNASSALSFTNATDWVNVPAISTGSEYTIQSWALFPLPSTADGHNTFVSDWNPGAEADLIFMTFHGTCGLAIGDQYAPGNCVQGIYGTELMASEIENGWHLITAVVFNGQTNFYFDGILLDTIDHTISGTIEAIGNNAADQGVAPQNAGTLDDVGIWNRALTGEEILSLYNAEPPVPGCTDPTACNYDAEATGDDGSCIFAPLVDLGEDIATCEESVILDAGEGFSHYEWNTGDTSRSIVVSEAGEYSVFTSNTAPNQHALKFNGNDASAQFAESIMFGMESFSVSVDCRLNDFSGNDSEPYSYIIGHPLTGGTNDHGFKIQTASNSLNGGFQAHINDEGTEHFNVISFDNSVEPNVELDQWYDLTMVVDRDNALFSFYIDGVLIDAQAIHPDFGNLDHPDGLSLGIQSIHQSSLLDGDLDNLHVWDIALSVEQIAQFQTSVPSGNEDGLVGFWNFEEGEGIEANDINGLAPSIQLNNAEWTEDGLLSMVDPACAAYDSIQISFLTSGCLDPEACNYNALAECEGEACDYTCCPGPGCCLDGTTWDADLGGCVPEGANDATANSCPHDIDFDGLIGVADLMDLLSVFGTDCAPADDPGETGEDSGGDPETAEFSCGGPVNYHGYDYATVQIGEQCWFAENLRYLPEVSPASDHSLSEPRGYVYGYNGSNVVEAKLTLNYETFGALYNFQAITQWAVCPVGWHVPSDDDWKDLELVLGVPSDSLDAVGYRGTDAGVKLKSDGLWDGSNESGMNMLPAGGTLDSGEFAFLTERGWFWTNTAAPQDAAWFRQLESNQNGIYRAHWNQNQEGGHSVRCLKDQ